MKLTRSEEPSAPTVAPEHDNAHHLLDQPEATLISLTGEATTGNVEEPGLQPFSDNQPAILLDRTGSEELPDESLRPSDNSSTAGEQMEQACLFALAAAMLLIDPFRMPEGPERGANGFPRGGVNDRNANQDS
jgi:hypothetical protein